MITRQTSETEAGAERRRFGTVLLTLGGLGVIGALLAGLVGWALAGQATRAIDETVSPLGDIVGDVAGTIEASQVMVRRTSEAVASIEDATRSTGRTLSSVGEVLDETVVLAGGGLADGLESAVGSLPALVDTSRIIDRTMRALRLLGVDYDPEVPLDRSLSELETSLRPIPGQLRDQISLIESARLDLTSIADDAGSLAAVLLEVRIDMMQAEQVLESAAVNVAGAEVALSAIERDIGSYGTLARLVVVGGAIALLTAAAAPLIIGLHYRRSPEGSP